MRELKKHKFSDLYEMSSGISSKPEQAGHGAPFCSFTTVFNNYFLPPELPDQMDTSIEEQKIYSLTKGDILLTRTSETLDELGMSCVAVKDYPNATFSGFLKRLRPTQNNVTYHKFMAFYLRGPLFRKAMNNNAVMTLRCSLNEIIFSYLDLLLPCFDQQVKIGDLLHQIQEKIELNNRISNELEGLVKLLYEYWFVQFDFPGANGKPYKSSGGPMKHNKSLGRDIPQDWQQVTLQDLINRSGTGLNPRDNFTLGGGEGFYVTIKNIEQGKVLLDEKCDRLSNEALDVIDRRSDLQVGDVLFTSIEPVGITYLLQEKPTNWNINESVFCIRVNQEKATPEFLYMLLSSPEMKAFTKNVSAGSIHKGIRHGILKTFKLPYGGGEIARSFSNLTRPILELRHALELEDRNLIELRDWLLPMLMNGQVTVC